ncbi:MAG: TetR/AcrR family transcriptional regulator [Bacteroidales bacterium]
MELKDRIIEIAFEQFALNGIKSVTMDEIARHIGISKRTLYEHFKDKETLVRDCMALCSKVGAEQRFEAMNRADNILELFFSFIENVSVYFRSFNRNFFRDLKKYHSKVYADYEATQSENVKDMIEMLKSGIGQGYIRSDINPELAMLLLRSQFDFLWFSDLPVAKNFTIVETVETMIVVFIRGISTEKGLKLIDDYQAKKNNN